ncbi:MAG: hypothetical protein IIA03_04125 [Proteobacteria bacterium]|nr:hypothetical protein [Pseudomonadota bacterium]
MLFLLSPAKSLDYDTPTPPELAASLTRPARQEALVVEAASGQPGDGKRGGERGCAGDRRHSMAGGDRCFD